MKIISIKPLKNKVVVYFKDSQIEISPLTYTEHNLFINKELSKDELDELKMEDSYLKSLSYALNLVSKYVYSSFTLKQKLINKKISNDHINKIIKYLSKHNLINDTEYASNYAYKMMLNHKGEYFIKAKLKSLGISDKDINNAISLLSEDEINDSLEIYIKQLNKKYQNNPNKKEKIINTLTRNGYSYSKIKEIMEE